MTWQARRRFGLRERSRSSLLPAALAHHHAQPCASRSTSQPAQSQLSHRTGRRRFASGMPAAWSPQRQELRVHADRGTSCSSPRGCQANPPACTLPFDASTTTLHNRPQSLFFAVQFCCVCAPRVCVLRVFTAQTEAPIGPPRLTQRTDGCLLVS